MGWPARLVNVFRSKRRNAEIDSELRFHLAEREDELTTTGMSQEAARREATRRFGNYVSLKERTGDMDISRRWELVLRDLQYGLRQLRLNPGFTTVAVLSLALGIGANSAMFQLLNAVRLRPLPVAAPEELATLTKSGAFYASGWSSGRNPAFTFAQFQEISRQQQAFSGLMAFATQQFNLSDSGQARYAQGLFITPNFLSVLGVRPQLGAWLPADADPRDCGHAGALLNHAFWQREFGGDPAIVGRPIRVNGHSFPIQAVTPASFFGVEPAYRFDVALPLCADTVLAERGDARIDLKWAWWLTMIGRLNPGWSVDRASAHLHDISPAVFRESVPDTYRPDAAASYLKNRLGVESAEAGVSSLRRQYEGSLWILLGMTGLVLLIACANLANLLLARAGVREREATLRQALGASRARLVAQLMTESVLLAVSGAVLGTWLAHGLSGALVAFLGGPQQSVYLPLGPDWRVLGFTSALAIGTCLLFGLVPALRATQSSPAAVMHGGRGAAATGERQVLRRALVVSQIAFSFVLLVGALLFVQSLRNLRMTDTGMVTDGVLAATMRTRIAPERRLVLFQEVEDRIRRLPDVSAAASVRYSPFTGGGWNQEVYAAGRASETSLTWFNLVSPGYFDTMRTPLLAGRDLSPADRAGALPVAIINQHMARQFFGDANPIGRQFGYAGGPGEADPLFTVVGVVGNTKYSGLREGTRAIAFLPVNQEMAVGDVLTIVVRARAGMTSVITGIERELAALDRNLLVEFRVLDAQIADSLRRDRLIANLSGGFGILAIVLSTLGLYGVMSYLVARRRAEIGVRMALGARRADIFTLVLGEAGRLVVVGIALGLAAARLLAGYAESLLFDLAPHDAGSLALAAALLIVTACAASLVPARRAAGVDAAVVLRGD
jgi:predicted permease